jgi:tetratricopeptide (TPR) repeat protein
MRPLKRSSILPLLLLAASGLAFGAEMKPVAGEKVRDKAALIEARENVMRDLNENPKSLAQWKRLAMIQRHLGDEKGTEAALGKASALDPKDAGVNFMRGLLYEKRADRAKAAASFRACLDNAAQDKIKELCSKHLLRTEKP